MTYVRGVADVVPPMVGTLTPGWSPIAVMPVASAFPASGTFEAADRAVYYPLRVPTTCVVRRVWWANGGTVNASYLIDCGIYADAGFKPGALLVSAGSTAQGTATQVQFVDVTDTTLAPGLYWIALASSSTSATIFRSNDMQASQNAAARFQEASARPLPATATPVETTNSQVYLCGFATTASP